MIKPFAPVESVRHILKSFPSHTRTPMGSGWLILFESEEDTKTVKTLVSSFHGWNVTNISGVSNVIQIQGPK
jgi:hypothetical protein